MLSPGNPEAMVDSVEDLVAEITRYKTKIQILEEENQSLKLENEISKPIQHNTDALQDEVKRLSNELQKKRELIVQFSNSLRTTQTALALQRDNILEIKNEVLNTLLGSESMMGLLNIQVWQYVYPCNIILYKTLVLYVLNLFNLLSCMIIKKHFSSVTCIGIKWCKLLLAK